MSKHFCALGCGSFDSNKELQAHIKKEHSPSQPNSLEDILYEFAGKVHVAPKRLDQALSQIQEHFRSLVMGDPHGTISFSDEENNFGAGYKRAIDDILAKLGNKDE